LVKHSVKQQHFILLITGLLLLASGLALLSLGAGPVQLKAEDIWQGLLWGEGGAGLIVRELRVPRTILALSIGFFMGLSGAVLQGLLRNPLADSAVFGAPQAAAFGAVCTLYFGFSGPLSFGLPVAAMAGALLSAGFVIVLSRSANSITLILAGLAIGALAGAGTSLALSLSANPFAITEIVFWLLGSLEDRSFRHVVMALPFLGAASLVLLKSGPALRALGLGDEIALTLGVRVDLWRWLIVASVAVGVGAATSVAGAIGFVGLAAPHLARSLMGSDPARLLLPSALIGAVLLLSADIAVRLLPSLTEVRIGVLTALLGVPFFLWIVMRSSREFSS
jgi:iron complex transport system permease protein